MLVPLAQIEQAFGFKMLEEGSQLKSEITEMWRLGYDSSQTEIQANCYDAYTQTWTTDLADEESWMDDLRTYLPITQMLVDTLRAAMINIMFPNDRYVSIENEIVGEFLTDVLLQNFAESDWITNTHEGILQAAICGDTFTLVRSKGPYFEAVPVSLQDIRIYPLHRDMTQTNKMILLRKSSWELANNPSTPYIQETVQTLTDKEDEIGDSVQASQKRTAPKNEYRRSENQKIGKGSILIEAHIPYMYFPKTKRAAKNIICTIDKDSQEIVRYTEQKTDELADKIVHTTWSQNTPNQFWGRGIVEPVLSIQSFMNSTLSNELVGGYLDNMGGIMYNATDPLTREYSASWELAPEAKWATTPNSMIQPIPRTPRRPFAFEYISIMKQELLELTNAQQPFSGGNNPAKFATVANIQFQAASGRVAATAAHWDEHYIKRLALRILRGIYAQMFQEVPSTAPFGQPQRRPNMQAIVFWMKKVGWDNQKIFQKINDPQFMSELATPIDLTRIQPTGTRTTTNKMERLERFERYVFGLVNTPSMQFGKWQNIPKIWAKLSDIPDAEDTYYSMEEMQQQYAEQQNEKAKAAQNNQVQIPQDQAQGMNQEAQAQMMNSQLMGMAA